MSVTANTVFVVDDDSSVLRALQRLLSRAGHEVLTFLSPGQFLKVHDPAAPGCALLDIAMDEMSGLDLQQALYQTGCQRPVIFLTGRGDIPTAVRAVKAGAVNFLTKPIVAGELLAAVRLALDQDAAARKTREELEIVTRRLASLTPREVEVFRHVVAGRLNKQIAGDLGTVEKTIKVHRARVMEKMAVRTLADLVRLTERWQI